MLGGVVAGAISIPGFSSAAGINTLRVSGDIVAGGKYYGNASSLTNWPAPFGPSVVVGPVSTLDVPTNTHQSTASCATGTSITGGGCEFSNYGTAMVYSSRPSANSWKCVMPLPPPAGTGADVTPVMTSATTPAPNIVSASSNWVGQCDQRDYKAFNGDVVGTSCDDYVSGENIPTGTLTFNFGAGNGKKIVNYTLKTSDYGATAMPKSWTFQGSNDGNFVTLDTRNNETGWVAGSGIVRTYTFANTTSYTQYRLNVLANNGFSQYWVVKEMQMMEEEQNLTMTAYALCQASQ